MTQYATNMNSVSVFSVKGPWLWDTFVLKYHAELGSKWKW